MVTDHCRQNESFCLTFWRTKSLCKQIFLNKMRREKLNGIEKIIAMFMAVKYVNFMAFFTGVSAHDFPDNSH